MDHFKILFFRSDVSRSDFFHGATVLTSNNGDWILVFSRKKRFSVRSHFVSLWSWRRTKIIHNFFFAAVVFNCFVRNETNVKKIHEKVHAEGTGFVLLLLLLLSLLLQLVLSLMLFRTELLKIKNRKIFDNLCLPRWVTSLDQSKF